MTPEQTMRTFSTIVLALILLISLIASTPASQSTREPATADSYILPYPEGNNYKLLQGYDGPYGHKGHTEFAYDFKMPIGSPVIAARAGDVVKVVESNQDGTRKPGEENVVVIRHSDGTFARYYHLTKDGALVSVGDKIVQGAKIALSGNSGASAGPHLHFDVTKDCHDWGCQTVKTEFTNVNENPLKQGQMYEPVKLKKN